MKQVKPLKERHFKIRTDLSREVGDMTFYRIQATRNSKHASLGELGGWVESPDVIHGDNAWIGGDALVFPSSKVSSFALITGNALVIDSYVSGRAVVKDNAELMGASVIENAIIENNARLFPKSEILGNAIISNNTEINQSRVYGWVKISGDVTIDNLDIGVKKHFCGENNQKHYSISHMKQLDNLFSISAKVSEIDDENSLKKAKIKSDEFVNATGGHYHFSQSYRILDEGMGDIARQIVASKDFIDANGNSIDKGTLGGYIVDEDSLKNNSWVSEGVTIYGGVSLDATAINEKIEIRHESDIPTGKEEKVIMPSPVL